MRVGPLGERLAFRRRGQGEHAVEQGVYVGVRHIPTLREKPDWAVPYQAAAVIGRRIRANGRPRKGAPENCNPITVRGTGSAYYRSRFERDEKQKLRAGKGRPKESDGDKSRNTRIKSLGTSQTVANITARLERDGKTAELAAIERGETAAKAREVLNRARRNGWQREESYFY